MVLRSRRGHVDRCPAPPARRDPRCRLPRARGRRRDPGPVARPVRRRRTGIAPIPGCRRARRRDSRGCAPRSARSRWDNELLRERARTLEAGHPLAPRRSKLLWGARMSFLFGGRGGERGRPRRPQRLASPMEHRARRQRDLASVASALVVAPLLEVPGLLRP